MPRSRSPSPESKRGARIEGPGVSVIPRLAGPPTPDTVDRVSRSLRTCWELGVRAFDIAGSTEPWTAAAILAAAFPDPPAGLFLIGPDDLEVRPPSRTRPAGVRSLWSDPAATASWMREVDRIVELRALPATAHDRAQLSAALAERRSGPRVLDVAVRCPSVAVARAVLALPSRPLAGVELSLLDRGPVSDLPHGPATDRRVIARGAFAGGRLSGGGLLDGGTARGGPTPPATVRELEEAFRPVVALAFLTERRARTLAQAAVQYLLAQPSVLLVSVDLPPVERLREIVALDGAAPLRDEEFARLGSPRSPPSEDAPSPGLGLK